MTNGVLDRNYKIGPAIISNNNKYYYKNGLLHNPFGPASIEDKSNKYYLMGIKYRKFNYNNKKELHGFQKAYRNGQWVKEIWIDGNKIEYDTLPVIIKKNKIKSIFETIIRFITLFYHFKTYILYVNII